MLQTRQQERLQVSHGILCILYKLNGDRKEEEGDLPDHAEDPTPSAPGAEETRQHVKRDIMAVMRATREYESLYLG